MRMTTLALSVALAAFYFSGNPAASAPASANLAANENAGTSIIVTPAASENQQRRASPCRPRYKRVCTPTYKKRCARPQYPRCVEQCRRFPPNTSQYRTCRTKCMSLHCRQVKVGETCRRMQVGSTCDHFGNRDSTGPVRPQPGPR